MDFCSLCDEVRRCDNEDSLTFAHGQHHIGVPSVGCFVPGYSLLVPRRHITSFAEMADEERRSADLLIDRLRDRIGETMVPAIVAEHGTGPEGGSGACCAHAHLHVIPVGQHWEAIYGQFATAGGASVLCKSIDELAQFSGCSYMMLSVARREYHVWTATGKFHRQFVRFAAAKAFGLEHYFDWKRYPFVSNMQLTYRVLHQQTYQ